MAAARIGNSRRAAARNATFQRPTAPAYTTFQHDTIKDNHVKSAASIQNITQLPHRLVLASMAYEYHGRHKIHHTRKPQSGWLRDHSFNPHTRTNISTPHRNRRSHVPRPFRSLSTRPHAPQTISTMDNSIRHEPSSRWNLGCSRTNEPLIAPSRTFHINILLLHNPKHRQRTPPMYR